MRGEHTSLGPDSQFDACSTPLVCKHIKHLSNLLKLLGNSIVCSVVSMFGQRAAALKYLATYMSTYLKERESQGKRVRSNNCLGSEILNFLRTSLPNLSSPELHDERPSKDLPSACSLWSLPVSIRREFLTYLFASANNSR